MKNINVELDDFLRNGPGERTKDQCTILKAYEVVISNISRGSVFEITNDMERIYNKL